MLRYVSASPVVSLTNVRIRLPPLSRITDHEELWQPAWGVRTGAFLRHSKLPALDLLPLAAIIGLQGFFPHKGESAVGVGALEYPIAERKRLAAL